jgi:hypothetical protein
MERGRRCAYHLAHRLDFASAQLSPPQPRVYYYSWIALFITFGIGYHLVYRDMYGNKNLVTLGIIGKLSFSAIFIAGIILNPGKIPLFFLIPVIGDLVFVVLFWKFLNYARSMGKRII